MPKIDHHINKNRSKLTDLLQQLVRIPTVNPPGENYSEIVDLIAEKCRSLGMATQIHSVPIEKAITQIPHADQFPRLNLIARWDVGAEKTIHFNSHFDVVPVSEGWTRSPFDPWIDGDWLYGRGTDDMKDSIAATLFAIQTLKANGVDPAFNIECSFTCDEEIGGLLGAGYVVENDLINADFVVNCEGGTRLDLGCGHNGIVWGEVIVHGKPAHGSRPHTGINAFEKMAKLAIFMKKKLGEKFVDPDRIFRTPAGVVRQPTINIGGVFGGSEGGKINTVPAVAKFTFDRRVTPSENIENVKTEIRQIVDDAKSEIKDLSAEIKTELCISPCFVATENTFVSAFKKSIDQVRGETPQFQTTTGFTDLHFFVSDQNLSGIGYGPWGENAHGIDERVSIADLIAVTKIYANFMANA